ncbi:MAG: sulfotransferase domain-containing protein [Pseudomonadota bacterium]
MALQRNIIWLASYPKSGNTWLRAFLTNYFIGGDGPLPLKDLGKLTESDCNAKRISEIAGQDHRELDQPAIYRARQMYLASLANRSKPTLVKTHNARGDVAGVEVIPVGISKAAVYLVRNPLDMLISYADHMGTSVEVAASNIADPRNIAPGSENQTVHFLGSWSAHVQSWLGGEGIPTQILRYEDMLDRPEKSFAAAVKAIGAPFDTTRLTRAIEASGFETLSRLEAEEGFGERSVAQERFFRKGKKDQWKETLPGAIVDRIVADHGDVMRFLKYL